VKQPLKYTLEMHKNNNRTETSEHISESESLLEATRKLASHEGAGFMVYSSAKCTNAGGVVLWQMSIN